MNGVFGKANFGAGKRNWWKLKDGENGPYRILPPMGDLSEEGRWSFFHKIHYGYRNSKNEMRTFVSPLVQNRKTKMVEVPDAALERIEQLKAKLDEAKKAGNGALVEKLLKLVGGKKSQFNLDSNHYLNVMDLQGNIGILKIRHRAKLALDAVIKKLRDAGTDPLDPNTGRFFVFSRSGMGQETIYQASVYKKQFQVADVGLVEQDVVHVITEDVARRCVVLNKDGSFTYKEAARLDTLFKKPTAEEVQRIVTEGPSAVDAILDTKKADTTTEYSSEDDSGMEDDETPTTQTATQTTTPAPMQAAPTVTATVVTTPVTTPTYTQTPAQTTPPTLTAVQTPAPTPVATVTALPKTTAQAVSEQTDEDFLKSLGL